MDGYDRVRQVEHLSKRLKLLACRLRWPHNVRFMLDELLTDEQRSSLQNPSAKFPDPIFVWADLHSLSPVIATLDLAREAELITKREQQRLSKLYRRLANLQGEELSTEETQRRKSDNRRMVKSQLLGKETHETKNGVKVHVALRDGKYIARGSIEGRRFGPMLGATVAEAEAELRSLLVAIENGTFVPPSEARRLPIREKLPPRLSIEQLVNRYHADVRGTRGGETAGTYLSRLKWLVSFAERPEVKRKWALALEVDRDFVLALRKFLYGQVTTPNGHPASVETNVSPRLVYNVLDCCRTMFNWGLRLDVRALPPGMMNPFTADLVGERPRKDPFRKNPLPVEDRVRIVRVMDRWELCQFVLTMILPNRPEDFQGLLVSDVHFDEHELVFGTRFGGADFNKNRLSYRVPFPAEIDAILRQCIDGRSEGPLLRSRPGGKRKRRTGPVSSTSDIATLFCQYQKRVRPNQLQAAQDLKILFRRMLADLGGLTDSSYRKAFTRIVARSGIERSLTPMNLRSAVTTEMKRIPIDRQVLLYVTGHELDRRDIINEYSGIEPRVEMDRYFASIAPLLTAITQRARELEIE